MKKKSGSKIIVNILSVLFILFILLELQIMFNYPDQFIWFVGIGALILIDVYFLVSIFVNQKNAVQADKEEQFENITKSEKASYLLLKKCFQDLDDRMSRLEDQLEPIESAIAENEIRVQKGLSQSVTDNKKMAKLLLGKNKEHTEALLNYNDEMQRVLKGFEQKLSDMESRIVQLRPSSGEGGMSTDQYQEIMASIQNLEMSFQRQVDQVYADGQVLESPVPVSELDFVEDPEPEEDMEPIEDLNLMEDTELMPEFSEEPKQSREPEIIPEPEPAPMSALQSLWKMQQEEKRAKEEAAAKAKAEAELKQMEELELVEKPEPIEELEIVEEPELVEEPEPVEESEPIEEPELIEEPEIVEEPELIEEPELMDVIESRKVPEPEEVLESELEEIFETGLEFGPEEVIEPESQSEEETSSMQDFGDPNKVMTPEEIAALIANM